MELALAISLGVGLASVAGVRAFVPLALAALVYVSLAASDPPNALLPILALGVPAVAALFVLAVLECAGDKSAAFARPLNWVMLPVRAVAGAVLFAAAMLVQGPPTLSSLSLSEALPTLAPWLAVGAVVAGVVAVLKVLLRPSGTSSAGVSPTFLSFSEDLVALVGGLLAVFVPFVPLALVLVAFLLYFFYRLKRRRGRKYGGLRILGD